MQVSNLHLQFSSGKLSDKRFQKLSADYEKEQHQLQEVASTLRGEIEAEERKSANVERFLSVVERYTEIPELTPCILHEFVEKIVVHADSDPKGKKGAEYHAEHQTHLRSA